VSLSGAGSVAATRDGAPAAVQAASLTIAGMGSNAGRDELIQTTSGWRQHLVDLVHRRGILWRACS